MQGAFAPHAMQEFKTDDTIGNRYKVLRKLGAGAMGSVYLCEDSVENNIKVALKVLISDNLDDQDVWAKGEYEALTRLRHPNLARVYNFGRLEETNEYFIVSEFIKGIDLYSATEYLDYEELADIIVQIARALEYIHAQGYVHFDIKPDNILVTRYKTVGIKEGSKVQYTESDLASSKRGVFAKPNVKLIDFGLAEKITGSFNFAIKGTLNYLAPEILNGTTPDKRADLYSLGVTIYQVANRDLPFYHETANVFQSAPITKRSDLFGLHMKKHPEYLRLLILKLLEERPEDRFQSAKEIIQFINKQTEYHFELETAETRASYFYSSKLVGRRREMNLLKEFHEQAFFPNRWKQRLEASVGGAVPAAVTDASVTKKLDDEPGAELRLLTPAEDASGAADLPSLILVSGEMGSGKSRLLEEFQHFLKMNDISHLAGNCYDGNIKAYQPFVEILRQIVYTFGVHSPFCRKWRQDFLRLLPELRDKRDTDGEQASGMRADKEKLYFIERLSQLLLDASLEAPYVLIINNLQWIDEASTELLANLLSRIKEIRSKGEQAPLLVIASVRQEEVHVENFRDMLEDLKKSGECHEIQVRRLKQSQVHEFLCAMLNFSDVPEPFVEKLVEKTGGNPLFIVETLKALQDDGVIRNVGDGWVIRATSFDRIEIPQSMEDLLEKRLGKLSSKKREILDILSVIDKPINPRFLQKIKRFEDVALLVELRDLEAAGLVSKTFEDGKLHFQIAQTKVREILYSRIPEETRQKYHGEVGGAFLELFRGKEDEILEELAFHFQRSEQAAKALELAIKAGDRLKAIYANDRALAYYLYVLEKVEGDPRQIALWIETQEKLGDLCTIMGRYDLADRSYSALLQSEMRKDFDPNRLVKIYNARGKVFEIQGDYEQSLRCYKDARNYLSSFERKKLIPERIHVFNSIGWVYVCMGKYEKAMAISLEALRVIEGGPERIEHAMVYNTIGSANYYKGNVREAIEYHRRSLQIRENLESIPEITISLNNLGSAHMAGTEYGEAAELFERALSTSEQIGDPYGKAVTLHNYARLYFAVGKTERAWQALEESMRLSKLYKMRFLGIQNYIVRGKALREQGDSTKAEGNFFRALTAFSKQGNRWGLCTVLLQICDLHRENGHMKEARTMLEEARRYAEELDIHNLRVQCCLEDARLVREEAAVGNGALEDAIRHLEEAKGLAEKCLNAELVAEVSFEMGETLVRLRRLREAPGHYKAAEEKFREIVENLPEEFRDSYSIRLRTKFRDWKAGSSLSKQPPRQDGGSRESGVPGAQPTGGAPASPEGLLPAVSAEESLRRVNALMEFLCSMGSLKEFLGRLLCDILVVLRAEAAYLLRVEGEDLTVEGFAAAKGVAVKDPEEALCLEIIEQVIARRRPLLLADIGDDPVVQKELDTQGKRMDSIAIVSFTVSAGSTGVLYVVNPHLPRGGGEGSLWLVQPYLNLIPLGYSQLRAEPVATS